MNKVLAKYLSKIYIAISSPYSIIIVALCIAAWIAVGKMMNFGERWFRNLEAASIFITLFMVFIIEHTQYVETKALQEKLDELIRKIPQADNRKVKLEKKLKGEKK
jgi:low affinity Fe/Cu permease